MKTLLFFALYVRSRGFTLLHTQEVEICKRGLEISMFSSELDCLWPQYFC